MKTRHGFEMMPEGGALAVCRGSPRRKGPSPPKLMCKIRIPQQAPEDTPVAHPIRFTGPAPYQRPFEGTGFGVVFEDDGETGYLYATNEGMDQILDALHLYNAGDTARLKPGEEAFIVWSPSSQKAGIFYHDAFQAVIDFRNKRACCRAGFPPPSQWCTSSHEWDSSLVKGLGP
jgi:hypothetical protein